MGCPIFLLQERMTWHPGCSGSVNARSVEVGTTRQVILYVGEDDYRVAECPSLPDCIRQSKTKEEAIANIREAIQEYIAALQEDSLPVPEERFDTPVVVV